MMYGSDDLLEVARFMREAEKRIREKMALGQHGTAFVEAARDMNARDDDDAAKQQEPQLKQAKG